MVTFLAGISASDIASLQLFYTVWCIFQHRKIKTSPTTEDLDSEPVNRYAPYGAFGERVCMLSEILHLHLNFFPFRTGSRFRVVGLFGGGGGDRRCF